MLYCKNLMGLCVSVLGLFICLVFTHTIVIYKRTNKINEKFFNAKMVTVSDFTIEGTISKFQY